MKTTWIEKWLSALNVRYTGALDMNLLLKINENFVSSYNLSREVRLENVFAWTFSILLK